jgi:hypothetical protein
MTRKKCLGIPERDIYKNKFFRGACGANGDFFYDSLFNGNVNFDGGGDVGNVSFFKSIWGRDRVVELVYMP